jgi:hypothetical protein
MTSPRAVPRREILFEPVRDRYGWRLALVFGNHAPGGLCPYYRANRCFHCDLGAGEGAAFDRAANRERLAWFRAHYRLNLHAIDHLVIYNSGSVLNPREMPPDLLDELVSFGRCLPSVRVISLDSREAYIRPDALRRILRGPGKGLLIRPGLGIETADDRIRDEVLEKRMPRGAIARVFRDVGLVAAEFDQGQVGLDVNILIAGPGTSAETAVGDAVATARDALDAGLRHGVNVDLNLHAYYVGPRGRARFPDHPRCSLATTVRAASKIAPLVRSMSPNSSLFIGWQDEGHDRDGPQRQLDLARARQAFDMFNQTNDPSALDCLEQSAPLGADRLKGRREKSR